MFPPNDFDTGEPPGALDITLQGENPKSTKAVFGQVGYDLTTALQLQVGLRYSKSTNRNNGVSAIPEFGLYLPQDAEESDSATTGKVALNRTLDPNDFLYAFVATGHKAGGPWSDLTKTGDSYFVNERVDNVLVTYDGVLGAAAKLYANGHDLKDPFLLPIYGDFHGFPPAILTTGTRDLFLSNTVRVHRKLKQAGVEAVLNVYEGQSHAQYALAADSPESAEAFTEIAAFFASHLAR